MCVIVIDSVFVWMCVCTGVCVCGDCVCVFYVCVVFVCFVIK